MNYRTLGVMLHNICTASCDICSMMCSPESKQMLEIDAIKKFISTCVGTSITTVSFTGGEPFIRFAELKELVAYTKECGLESTVVTNGFWAYNYDVTYQKLQELKKAGIEHLNISYDNHHAQFISLENINNIVKVCNTINLSYVIAIVRLKDEDVGHLISDIRTDIGTIKLLIAPCEPAGNAKVNFESNKFVKNVDTSKMGCPYDGIITIYCDGRIFPCCSHYVFGTQLSIGHYKEIGMDEALNRIKNNGLLYILRNYGLNPILDMNKKVSVEKYVSSPCEVCSLLCSENVGDYLNPIKMFLKEHKLTQK